MFPEIKKIAFLLLFLCQTFCIKLSAYSINPMVLGYKQVETFHFPEAMIVGPNTVRVPFKLAGRLIVVNASIEGEEGNFIIDTGASRLVLNSSYFEGDYSLDHVMAGGTTGFIDEVSFKRVERFQWDKFIQPKLRADVVDLSHIEDKKKLKVLGLIGHDVLKDFEICFDFSLRQIVLAKLDKDGMHLDPNVYFEEQAIDSVDFDLKRYVILLDAQVQDHKVKFSLDSGAELNLLDRKVKRKVMDHFKILKRTVLMGAGSKKVEVLAGKLYRVRMGDIRCAGMRTLITNLDDIRKTYNVKIDGVLGFDFFAPRRTAINYKKKKLYFFQWNVMKR